ncbi:hypothetical protein T05_10489 [Trichinella murrelli]|uniref:PiggyBac transposable element-derived protein domain-containing protein n=1 Tax=Trichinella murrelli TaxID=144512 RepID=A0A0V0U8W9_9BILA|nr:hypothetical protein T05_10489 [Trichinella murrelli]
MYNHWSERYQKLPEHRRDLEIPGAFRKTKAGEDLLLWQSASRHTVVFATGNNIRLLGQTKTWGTEGTFKVLPQWYQQLFTIHDFVAGKLVPAVCWQEWITDERLPLWNVHNVNIRTNNHSEGWHTRLNKKRLLISMGTLIQQVLSRNATVGDLGQVNKVYAEKQQRVAQYTGEYTSGSCTLEQYLESLMYITTELI